MAKNNCVIYKSREHCILNFSVMTQKGISFDFIAHPIVNKALTQEEQDINTD